jgi:futalosine hydrolase
MRILIVAATKFEIRPLLNHFAFLGDENEQLSHYQYRNTIVDLLIPGVGMVQTAYHLSRQLASTRYDIAINGGIAGSYTSNLALGEVVHVVEECIAEMGAEDGDRFLTMFQLGLMDPDAPPYKNGRLLNETPLRGVIFSKLRRVKGATSNTVHANPDTIKKITTQFSPDVESMEGASFLYSCLSSSVQCYQIRAVSNYVEERDKSRWNIDLALKNLNKVLLDIMKDTCK